MKVYKKIKLRSEKYETDADVENILKSLFDANDLSDADSSFINDYVPKKSGEPEVTEISTLGTLEVKDDAVSITYDENELTGMAGATTRIGWKPSDKVVTMMRGGDYMTALVFEEGKHHICVYNTPFMVFEMCIYTKKADNRLLEDGVLILEYIIEIRGASAEHNLLTLTISDNI